MLRPQMVIIMENTLSAIALRTLVVDIAAGLDVVCYSKFEDYTAADSNVVAHFIVSAEIIFHHADFFRQMARRTIVVTDGEAAPFLQSGFRAIDSRASEQDIARAVLQFHHCGHPDGHPHVESAEGRGGGAALPLSARECEVLALVVKGLINKEIADRLGISLATVVYHRNNISEKLGTRSIGRLTIYAVLNNIVELSEI